MSNFKIGAIVKSRSLIDPYESIRKTIDKLKVGESFPIESDDRRELVRIRTAMYTAYKKSNLLLTTKFISKSVLVFCLVDLVNPATPDIKMNASKLRISHVDKPRPVSVHKVNTEKSVPVNSAVDRVYQTLVTMGPNAFGPLEITDAYNRKFASLRGAVQPTTIHMSLNKLISSKLIQRVERGKYLVVRN